MDYLVIQGRTVYDGRYEFDTEGREFSVREWGWIKRHAGYLPGNVTEGYSGADPELFCVFAVIALVRAKRIGTADVPRAMEVLLDAPASLTIRLESDDEELQEEEEVLPPSPSPSSSENGRFSGDDSRTNSETSDETPPATGTPDLATSESRPVPPWET